MMQCKTLYVFFHLCHHRNSFTINNTEILVNTNKPILDSNDSYVVLTSYDFSIKIEVHMITWQTV